MSSRSLSSDFSFQRFSLQLFRIDARSEKASRQFVSRDLSKFVA
jgi:hypothetical protein